MNYTDLKVGDTIRILKKPAYWNSRCNGNNPLKMTYPFVGTIKRFDGQDKSAGDISGYGFAMDYIKFELLNGNYEIY